VFAGKLASLLFVDHQRVDAREHRSQRFGLALDPEVHRVGHDELRVFHLIEHRHLERRVNVAEQHERRLGVVARDLRIERGEHVQLRVERVPRGQVLVVATGPAEGLAAGLFHAFRVHAAPREALLHGTRKVVTDHGDETNGGVQRGGERAVGGRAAHDVAERARREVEIVERHGADDENRVGHLVYPDRVKGRRLARPTKGWSTNRVVPA
jgi:hypothetical protein